MFLVSKPRTQEGAASTPALYKLTRQAQLTQAQPAELHERNHTTTARSPERKQHASAPPACTPLKNVVSTAVPKLYTDAAWQPSAGLRFPPQADHWVLLSALPSPWAAASRPGGPALPAPARKRY